ncbi:carbohydrate ABC transporter permease [Microbacterium telephonicum]|uniref:Multiple sugar transport system permease protein n=1 Tax=Microbacterium telephonicum TaxID=1714841 RepID=A0A498BRL8_9MICO|nr:sugar ABC transporter permease [Microbacterium telephonicum]RLK46585.1 multiple sugar transport system permease protein [Microbacterium telephonicum]
MSTTLTEAVITAPRRGSHHKPPRRRAPHRAEVRGAWVLMAPYILLFLVAAAIPIVYALYISFQKPATLVNPQSGFGGFDAYITAVTDYRFVDTFVNIFTVMIVWLPLMILVIVGLALLIHASPGRFGGAMRFVYFIPGALAGIANFVLWVYLLNPSQSPIAFLWRGAGLDTLKEVTTTENLPWILTAMLFFQGVGTWIVVVNGGLNGIPDEIFEAASLDGANAWQLAWHVKLPLIRPWIGYAALMNVAYGFQLFLEPYLLRQISAGSVDAEWAPTQLGYAFAFTNRNFPAAAAMSVILLVITLVIGMIIVFRSGLFGDEKEKAR